MTKTTGQVLAALAICANVFVCVHQAEGAPKQVDAQTFLREGKWREALRAILLEAPRDSLYAFDVPPVLASQGYVDDALRVIDSERPDAQASARLSLISKVATDTEKRRSTLRLPAPRAVLLALTVPADKIARALPRSENAGELYRQKQP